MSGTSCHFCVFVRYQSIAFADFNFPTFLTLPVQYCLRIDATEIWTITKLAKIVLCFMDESEYLRAAHSIRKAQYEHFCRVRVESQASGAIHADELLSLFARSNASESTDIRVKVGVGEEGVRCVSVDKEALVIECKSKGFAGGLRTKRILISILGQPVMFVNPVTIGVHYTRDADILFTFPDSLARDLFALKLFLQSKQSNAAWFAVSASSASPLKPVASLRRALSVTKSQSSDPNPGYSFSPVWFLMLAAFAVF
jgi:hypothetical protein